MPYSTAALNDWLKSPPESFCSPDTALQMAVRSHERACSLAERLRLVPAQALGLGGTASLVSAQPKRGPHRLHIAAHAAGVTRLASLELAKGRRDRPGEESVVSQIALGLLAATAGCPGGDDLLGDRAALGLFADEQIAFAAAAGQPLLVDLVAGRRDVVWRLPDGQFSPDPPAAVRGLLCGSFNPLHRGHMDLRALAERRLGGPVHYEISLRNVDKPPLDYIRLERRLAQFGGPAETQPVALTNAPTYREKCRVLPGLTWVVGVDTARRVIDPLYYGSPAATRAGLLEIQASGNRFLTASREVDGQLLELSDLPLPAEFSSLFTAIPASEFRVDLSSTQLRLSQPEGM